MMNLKHDKISDLVINFPPYYGVDEYDEYPIDTKALLDKLNDKISDELVELGFNPMFYISFDNIYPHYDGAYSRAEAGEINPELTFWEYLYDVIVIDDIYDSTEYYQAEYADLVAETLESQSDINSAFDIIENTVRLNNDKYEYDENKQWYEEDFIYRRQLCKYAVTALMEIAELVDKTNENIQNQVKLW